MAHRQGHGRDVTERVAVYGGSFDPPHIAHVLVAAWALAMGEVDRVLVLPTFSHALGKASGATFEQRMAMCELAFAALRGVAIDPLEQQLGAPSRTYNTLLALRDRDPRATFRLVIGADILEETHRWYRWEDIAELAPPLVVGRGGYTAAGASDEGAQGEPPRPREPAELLVMPEVSSTRVRAAIARGASVDAWVPAAVRRYVRQHGLYAEEPAS